MPLAQLYRNTTFTEWLKRSIPIFLITFPIMETVLTLYFKPNRKISIGVTVFEKDKAAPLKTLAAIFLTAVLLWTTERILSPLLNIAEALTAVLITSVPMIVFIWIIVISGIIFTEFMSNTGNAAMILPFAVYTRYSTAY